MKIEEKISNLEALVTRINAELAAVKEELDQKEERILELEAEVTKASVNNSVDIKADCIESAVGNTKIVHTKDAITLKAEQIEVKSKN